MQGARARDVTKVGAGSHVPPLCSMDELEDGVRPRRGRPAHQSVYSYTV